MLVKYYRKFNSLSSGNKIFKSFNKFRRRISRLQFYLGHNVFELENVIIWGFSAVKTRE